MPTRGYLLSEEFKPRVEGAVQTVERELKGGVGPRAPGPQKTSANVQRLRISASEPLANVAGVDYWLAWTLTFDSELGDWVALFDDADAVVFDTTGTLSSGSGNGVESDVFGRQVMAADIDGVPWPTFAVMSGAAGSGVSLVRVLSDSPINSGSLIDCGSGEGSGSYNGGCPPGSEPPLNTGYHGPIYDAVLLGPPERTGILPANVFGDYVTIRPVWLMQANGYLANANNLAANSVWLSKRLIAEEVCLCGEYRPLYVVDDFGEASPDGFWAQITATPDDTFGSGTPATCGDLADPATAACMRPGYAWAQGAWTCCENEWVILSGDAGLLNHGTVCHRQAYEANNQPVPVGTIVRMYRRPTYGTVEGSGGADAPCPETFIFIRPGAPDSSGGGSGGGCQGIRASSFIDLANCTTRGCIGIVNNRLVLTDDSGNILDGG